MPDEDSQVLRLILIVRPPDSAQQRAMGDHLASVRGQILEHLIFCGCEVYLSSVYSHLSPLEVDGQATALKARCASRAPSALSDMPERHTDASDEFTHAEGLGQIVVGSQLQRRNLIGVS